MPLAFAAALIGFGAAPSVATRDQQDIAATLKTYFSRAGGHYLGRAEVHLALNRAGAVAPTDNTRCVMSGYTVESVVEHPAVGYVPWIKWAERNGIVEEQTVGTLNGAPWRCPFVVEQQVLTDYRMMWDRKPGLVVWLTMENNWQFVALKQSVSTVAGVPNVPTFDMMLDIVAPPLWPGVSITPNPMHSTVRLVRSPKTGKLEVLKADLHTPTIKLDE